ncbi:MAG TPA: M28 family metallopeptidase [Thermoleophilaceae bacterium]
MNRHNLRVRILFAVLAVQLVLGATVATLAATNSLPFPGKHGSPDPVPARLKADRFDAGRAWRLLKLQLSFGPRPAGSESSRRLAETLRRKLPHGRFQAVPGGLRNVIGSVPGKDPHRIVVVGAHYDTKDIPGFLGANDGASGTAVVLELAGRLKPREARPTVVFALFDGEESPAGTPDSQFEQYGLRGSRVAAARYPHAAAMILFDFVGDRELRLPRERSSNTRLWGKLRSAARRVGAIGAFPLASEARITDDHTPFLSEGVPSIDLIDWDFACFHRTCDNLSAVSPKSLDAVGESVAQLLRTL